MGIDEIPKKESPRERVSLKKVICGVNLGDIVC